MSAVTDNEVAVAVVEAELTVEGHVAADHIPVLLTTDAVVGKLLVAALQHSVLSAVLRRAVGRDVRHGGFQRQAGQDREVASGVATIVVVERAAQETAAVVELLTFLHADGAPAAVAVCGDAVAKFVPAQGKVAACVDTAGSAGSIDAAAIHCQVVILDIDAILATIRIDDATVDKKVTVVRIESLTRCIRHIGRKRAGTLTLAVDAEVIVGVNTTVTTSVDGKNSTIT